MASGSEDLNPYSLAKIHKQMYPSKISLGMLSGQVSGAAYEQTFHTHGDFKLRVDDKDIIEDLKRHIEFLKQEIAVLRKNAK